MISTVTTTTNILIIGVDPGKTTGLAWLDNKTFYSTDYNALSACDKIFELITTYDGKVIVAVEPYNITRQTIKFTRQYDALEVIGTCKWMSYKYGAEFILQAASAAQPAGNVDLLKQLGWWVSSKDHCNKAASQVVLAYQRVFPTRIHNMTNLS